MVREKTSRRNEHGVKHCSDCYLTVRGKLYLAWSDDPAIVETCKASNYHKEYIFRTIDKSFVRVYVLASVVS